MKREGGAQRDLMTAWGGEGCSGDSRNKPGGGGGGGFLGNLTG